MITGQGRWGLYVKRPSAMIEYYRQAPLEEKLLGLMRKLDGDAEAGDDGAAAETSEARIEAAVNGGDEEHDDERVEDVEAGGREARAEGGQVELEALQLDATQLAPLQALELIRGRVVRPLVERHRLQILQRLLPLPPLGPARHGSIHTAQAHHVHVLRDELLLFLELLVPPFLNISDFLFQGLQFLCCE
mgnify:CR=1 FL=1